MTITTLAYLGFFAAVAVVCYALPRAARPYFLLFASYAFFVWTPENRALLWVLLGSTALTWVCGLVIGRVRVRAVRVLFLLLAIAGCTGILLYYKYWDMLAAAAAALAGQPAPEPLRLLAPLGLSYFIFAALSYPIDVFKHRCRVEVNPLHYALFVSFFPTLITGPIERYPHLRPQIQKSRRFSYGRCAGGAFRMLWGYCKKMVLADNLNLYVSLVYGTPQQMSGPNLVAATLLFSLRLYMDFSGCCDIALGAARILGYDLIENFHSPFEATSFSDFWRRWHISMTGWFRDYVYFPLGGSRCALWRQLLNLIAVFLVSGLWHGADWRYLVWGLSCGLISAFARLTARPRRWLASRNPLYRAVWLRVLIQRCIVYLLFSFTIVFFAAANYNVDPWAVLSGMGAGWQGLAGSWQPVRDLILSSGIDGNLPVVLTCGAAIVLAVEHSCDNVARWIRQQNFVLRWVLYYGACAAMLFFAAFGQSVFIYQNY